MCEVGWLGRRGRMSPRRLELAGGSWRALALGVPAAPSLFIVAVQVSLHSRSRGAIDKPNKFQISNGANPVGTQRGWAYPGGVA